MQNKKQKGKPSIVVTAVCCPMGPKKASRGFRKLRIPFGDVLGFTTIKIIALGGLMGVPLFVEATI